MQLRETNFVTKEKQRITTYPKHKTKNKVQFNKKNKLIIIIQKNVTSEIN